MPTLCLLGPPRLETGQKTLIPDRRTAGMLAYLALEGTAHKYRLAGWLWPDSSEESAKNNMRQLLRRLRLGAGEVVRGEDHLELASGVEVDLRHLSYLESPSLEVLRQDAELLEGFDYDDAPDFEEWLAVAREELRQLRVRSARAEAERLETARDHKGALEYAQVWARLEPLSEEAHRLLIRLHYLLGDRGAALSAFEGFKALLDKQLGIEPLPETLALARVIEQGAALPGGSSKPKQTILPASASRPPVLAGREREWQLIEDAWQQGKSIFLIGEPGSGKSRLATDFLASKGRFIHLQTRPGDFNVPYSTNNRFVRIMLAQYPNYQPPDWVRQTLAHWLPELGDAPPVPDPAIQSRYYEAMGDVFNQIGRHGESIFIDDNQFMDPISMQTGNFLLSQLFPLGQPGGIPGFITCYRKDELSPEQEQIHADMIAQGMAVRIALEPLPSEAVRVMLEGLGVENVEELVPGLSRYTGGNPLFITETIKHLIETGTLEQGLPSRLAPPGKVAALVGRRLQRLSPQALNLARAAAVAGTSFDVKLASHVLERPTMELAEAHAELEAAQILKGNAFVHDLVYEATLGGIPAAVQQVLNSRTAQHLEAVGANPALVAQHWLEAGEPNQAIPRLLDAAERAQAGLRLDDSVALYGRAAEVLDGLGETDRAFEVRFAQARRRMDTDVSEATRALVARLGREARKPRQRAQSALLEAFLLDHEGHLDQADAAAERGLGFARLIGDLSLEAELLEARASVRIGTGRPAEAAPFIERMADIYREQDNAAGLCNATVGLGFVYRRNDRARARGYFREAYRLAALADLPHEQVSGLNNAARMDYELGEVRSALAAFDEAARLLADTGGAVDVRLVTQSGLAYCRRALGDLARSLQAVADGLELGEGRQMGMTGVLHLHKALTLELLGNTEGARHAWQAAADAPGFPPYNRPQLLTVEALLWRDRTPLAEARRIAEDGQDGFEVYRAALTEAELVEAPQRLPILQDALEGVRSQSLRGLELSVLAAQAQAYLELGQTELALLSSSQAVELGERYAAPTHNALAWITHAGALEAAGQPGAEVWLERARAWALEAAARLPDGLRQSFLELPLYRSALGVER